MNPSAPTRGSGSPRSPTSGWPSWRRACAAGVRRHRAADRAAWGLGPRACRGGARPSTGSGPRSRGHGSGRELCAADAGTVATTQAFLKECVDVGGGRRRRRDRRADLRVRRADVADVAGERAVLYAELRENLRPVAEYGGERGVKVAVEPLVRYETSVINTVEQALEAIDGLPGRGVRAAARHLPRERGGEGLRRLVPPRRRADRARPRVGQRPRRAGGRPHRLAGFRDASAPRATTGPVVIESFTAENETIATAASVWRPLAASQDAIAVDGLAFLRDLFA